MTDDFPSFIASKFLVDGKIQQLYVESHEYLKIYKTAIQSSDKSLKELCKNALYYSYSEVKLMLKVLSVFENEKSIKIWRFILLNFKKQDVNAIIKFMISNPVSVIYTFHHLNEPYLTIFLVLLVLACRSPAFKSLIIQIAIRSVDIRYHRLLIKLNYSERIPNNLLSHSFDDVFYTQQVHFEHNYRKGIAKYNAVGPKSLSFCIGTFDDDVAAFIKRKPGNYLDECVYYCSILYYLKMSNKDHVKQCLGVLPQQVKSKCSDYYKYATSVPKHEPGPMAQYGDGFKLYMKLPISKDRDILHKIKRFKLDLEKYILNDSEKRELKTIVEKHLN